MAPCFLNFVDVTEFKRIPAHDVLNCIISIVTVLFANVFGYTAHVVQSSIY